MKTKLLILVVAMLAAGVLARGQDTNFAVRLACEMQTAGPASLSDLTWQQGTTPHIAVSPLRLGRPIAVDPLTSVRMIIGQSGMVTNYALATNWLATNGVYYVQWPTVGTNSAGTNAAAQAWWYTVHFERDGRRYWTGDGRLYIEPTTSTAADGLTWQTITAGAAIDTVARAQIEALSNEVAGIEVGAVAYGITTNTAYEGNLGHAVSNLARTAYTTATGAAAVAAAALPASDLPTNAYCTGTAYNENSFRAYPVSYIDPTSTNILTSTVTTNAEYVQAYVTYSSAGGYSMNPLIWNQSLTSTGISWTISSTGGTATITGERMVFGSETQAVVTGTLGDWSASTNLYRKASAIAGQTNVTGAVAGTARGLADGQLRPGATASKTAAMFTGYTINTNCWLAMTTNHPTCVSVSNSASEVYYKVTAITPEHVIYANHFGPPFEAEILFIDATNGHHRTTLVSYLSAYGDIAVGKIDPPLPASIVPAKFMPDNWTNYIGDTLQFPVMYTDASKYARIGVLARGAFSSDRITVYPPPAAPYSAYYKRPVGGDSGNPIFACFGPGEHAILSAFYTADYGDSYLYRKAEIMAAIGLLGGETTTVEEVDFGALGAETLD